MIGRLLAAIVILGVALALLVALWPSLFGLEHTIGVAQVIAFRALGVIAAAVGVVLFLLLALMSRAARRFAASLALVFLIFGVAGTLVLASRGFGDTAFETRDANDLTVLSWNTLGGAPDPQVLADLVVKDHVDVVTLPETTKDYGTSVALHLEDAGVTMQVLTVAFDQISKARSTTMLVAKSLGTYAIDSAAGSTGRLPTVIAKPVDGHGPTLMAVHAVSPVPSELPVWRNDLAFLAKTCVGPNVIMAGDFNSTIDHFAREPHATGATLGDCADAGLATGNGAVGSWPTSIPALLGTPIDHVMTTPNWRVTGMRVIQSLDAAGSDHRPVLVQLSPASR